jgi:hypothetical protein
MAKKKAAPQPVISEIPMPVSDSPLVIDLPDGQKLVVGKMSPGSVIEVATWRGTGRPDSRTSRLMLGMSSAEQVQAQAQSEKEIKSAKGKGKFDWKKPELGSIDFIGIGRRLAKAPGALLTRISIKNRFAKNEGLTSQNLTEKTNGSENLEIEVWLNQLTDKSRTNVVKSAKKAPAKKSAVKKSPR